MLVYLILALTAVPFLELALLIKLGQHLGLMPTILLVIGTGIAGAALAKLQGLKVLWDIRELLQRGIMPGNQLLEGLFILLGAVLLLTPGLITDTIGFLCLLPLPRSILVGLVKRKIEEYLRTGTLRIFMR
ncbi:MAG: FxsA family protein [Clostridia bacterium]|jgi:UPF0716 protein FxsA|nr:FxsA family protein [Clostridia bacterium]